MCLRTVRAMNLGGQCVAATHPDLALRRPTFPIHASYQRISLSLFLFSPTDTNVVEGVIIPSFCFDRESITLVFVFDEAPV